MYPGNISAAVAVWTQAQWNIGVNRRESLFVIRFRFSGPGSEAVALGHPIVPVTDGPSGGIIGIHRNQL